MGEVQIVLRVVSVIAIVAVFGYLISVGLNIKKPKL
jgi:hypothetical protein